MSAKSIEHFHIGQFLRLAEGEIASESLEINLDTATEIIGFKLSQPITINLDVGRDKQTLIIDLTAITAYQANCVRCQKEAEVNINQTEQFEYSSDAEDLSMKIANDHINLSQAIVDTVNAAIVEYPLCQPECLGLCPTCGANLNSESDHFQKHPDHKPSISKVKLVK